jgi:hypothetical protein
MAILQVAHRCPHCGEHKDFVLFQASEIVRSDISQIAEPLWADTDPRLPPSARRRAANGAEFCALSRCPHCKNPTMFVLLAVDTHLSTAMGSPQGFDANSRLLSQFRVLATYPETPRFDAHPSWPERIRQPFVEMQEDMRRQRTPAFIIAGCRTILDVATKDLGGQGNSIFARVADLRARGLLTGALGDWADEIRKRGNDAVHDLEGDAETARQFVEFLRLFLHVAYELPESIANQRGAGS